MTPPPLRPDDITETDELKSLAFYLSLQFPDDEIRRSRPHEDEPYDMLIDSSIGTIFEQRGAYLADSTKTLVIQRWCDDYDTALDYSEQLARLMMVGITPGERRRIPVWKWDFTLPQVEPVVGTDEPDRFLRVASCQTRILPVDAPAQFVVACEVVLKGWRITHTFTDQLIEVVDLQPDELA